METNNTVAAHLASNLSATGRLYLENTVRMLAEQGMAITTDSIRASAQASQAFYAGDAALVAGYAEVIAACASVKGFELDGE